MLYWAWHVHRRSGSLRGHRLRHIQSILEPPCAITRVAASCSLGFCFFVYVPQSNTRNGVVLHGRPSQGILDQTCMFDNYRVISRLHASCTAPLLVAFCTERAHQYQPTRDRHHDYHNCHDDRSQSSTVQFVVEYLCIAHCNVLSLTSGQGRCHQFQITVHAALERR